MMYIVWRDCLHRSDRITSLAFFLFTQGIQKGLENSPLFYELLLLI